MEKNYSQPNRYTNGYVAQPGYVGNYPSSGTIQQLRSTRGVFDEPFAGVTQSLDGSSVCVNYTVLFWLVVIILLVILWLKYRHSNVITI